MLLQERRAPRERLLQRAGFIVSIRVTGVNLTGMHTGSAWLLTVMGQNRRMPGQKLHHLLHTSASLVEVGVFFLLLMPAS